MQVHAALYMLPCYTVSTINFLIIFRNVHFVVSSPVCVSMNTQVYTQQQFLLLKHSFLHKWNRTWKLPYFPAVLLYALASRNLQQDLSSLAEEVNSPIPFGGLPVVWLWHSSMHSEVSACGHYYLWTTGITHLYMVEKEDDWRQAERNLCNYNF